MTKKITVEIENELLYQYLIEKKKESNIDWTELLCYQIRNDLSKKYDIYIGSRPKLSLSFFKKGDNVLVCASDFGIDCEYATVVSAPSVLCQMKDPFLTPIILDIYGEEKAIPISSIFKIDDYQKK